MHDALKQRHRRGVHGRRVLALILLGLIVAMLYNGCGGWTVLIFFMIWGMMTSDPERGVKLMDAITSHIIMYHQLPESEREQFIRYAMDEFTGAMSSLT